MAKNGQRHQAVPLREQLQARLHLAHRPNGLVQVILDIVQLGRGNCNLICLQFPSLLIDTARTPTWTTNVHILCFGITKQLNQSKHPSVVEKCLGQKVTTDSRAQAVL